MSDFHPLYPEQLKTKGVRWISLYEPQECMMCHKMCENHEWKNITRSDSHYLEPGIKLSVEFLRVCKPCSMNDTAFSMWG